MKSTPFDLIILAISGTLSKFFASQNLPIESNLTESPVISFSTLNKSACSSIKSFDRIFSIFTILFSRDGKVDKKALVTSSEIETILSNFDHIANSDLTSNSIVE